MVIRSGGDAGTVTHTSVPSEIVATIPSALPVWADIGLGAESWGRFFGGTHAGSYREFRF